MVTGNRRVALGELVALGGLRLVDLGNRIAGVDTIAAAYGADAHGWVEAATWLAEHDRRERPVDYPTWDDLDRDGWSSS